ncbi:37S ribosomal protein S23 mitochondrial [Ascosphaera aggregata]|nr:37S ribosomal protein S23 mitochondrial [Ascosphaera aggregata]
MSWLPCKGCFLRLQSSQRVLQSPTLARVASFHSTSSRAALPQKKSASHDNGPKFRERRSVLITRKAVVRKPPMQVGELRAARERIVLGNANALAVPTVKDLGLRNIADDAMVGKILSFPMTLLDKLKNTKAFRTTQKWALFHRPATMIRRETFELARAMNDITETKTSAVRFVTGRKGTGKSVLLTQAMAMAFLKNWIVISIPEAQDLVNGHTAYAPVTVGEKTKYVQTDAVAAMLHRIAFSNASVLSKLHISQHNPLLRSLSPDTNLQTLAFMGIDDPTIAWTVFQALWIELTATAPAKGIEGMQEFKPRPPILLTVDNISHWMKETKYRDANFNPIHAHDLLLVEFFLKVMRSTSESSALPNGGLVVFSTSTSNAPNVESFNVLLNQLKARDNGVATASPEFPRINPYSNEDQRVLDLFNSCSQTQVFDIQGLTKQETKVLMEYYAFSGLLREKIDQTTVSEKWTLSGGGVIGELEKLALRLRTPPSPAAP